MALPPDSEDDEDGHQAEAAPVAGDHVGNGPVAGNEDGAVAASAPALANSIDLSFLKRPPGAANHCLCPWRRSRGLCISDAVIPFWLCIPLGR